MLLVSTLTAIWKKMARYGALLTSARGFAQGSAGSYLTQSKQAVTSRQLSFGGTDDAAEFIGVRLSKRCMALHT